MFGRYTRRRQLSATVYQCHARYQTEPVATYSMMSFVKILEQVGEALLVSFRIRLSSVLEEGIHSV